MPPRFFADCRLCDWPSPPAPPPSLSDKKLLVPRLHLALRHRSPLGRVWQIPTPSGFQRVTRRTRTTTTTTTTNQPRPFSPARKPAMSQTNFDDSDDEAPTLVDVAELAAADDDTEPCSSSEAKVPITIVTGYLGAGSELFLGCTFALDCLTPDCRNHPHELHPQRAALEKDSCYLERLVPGLELPPRRASFGAATPTLYR